MKATATPDPTRPEMPDFAGGSHAHHHSVHSALVSLQALGVSLQRLTLYRAGRHAMAPGLIVKQSPQPGVPLSADTRIELHIAGLGFIHALPVGMRESGGEASAGAREILESFDDPLEKLKHWFHEGAPLFRIAPDNPQACVRWLSLFGIDADEWPRSIWYPLAAVIARMPQISCSEDGSGFLLRVLLGLPIRKLSYHASASSLPEHTLSRLGTQASQLGVDLIMGDCVEDLSILDIDIGPVPLSTYQHFVETSEGAKLLHRVLELAMPISTRFDLKWTVEDLRQAPCLGVAEKNARLGINTHMGMELSVKEHSQLMRITREDAVEDTMWSQQ